MTDDCISRQKLLLEKQLESLKQHITQEAEQKRTAALLSPAAEHEKAAAARRPAIRAETEEPSGDYDRNRTFTSIDMQMSDMTDHTFDSCVFKSCSFYKTPLSGTAFQNCVFTGCQFVLCPMNGTSWNSVHFKDCKLMGMNFTDCADFGFAQSFDNCLIDSTTFYGNNLSECKILNSTIRSSDFSICRLIKTDFSGTRFQNTSFRGCHMEKADFTSAENYDINPAANKIKGARFSLPAAGSFLKYLDIVLE